MPSSSVGSLSSSSRQPTTAPSSPPAIPGPGKPRYVDDKHLDFAEEEARLLKLQEEEEKAQIANQMAEKRRIAAARRKNKKKKILSPEERAASAGALDELLLKSQAFSNILLGKTKAMGRVGTGLDGHSLAEKGVKIVDQPNCMTGGQMRDYQLEGVTWMSEVCEQGMSGILADEMGLGKTIQTIGLIALLRERDNYLGPHLIVAPLSTLSNWMEEFRKWTPTIPVVMYHGTQPERNEIAKNDLKKNLKKNGRPTTKFPVVCTSYEMVLRDRANLGSIEWEFIIIDEGHRMKNFDSKLFRELKTFQSATRLLITGTPLQNNLKELWSLLHFLMPKVFTNFEDFENWFDFSNDLYDEDEAAVFIEDQEKQQLIKKIHFILQPLLLRRVKADVAAYLPKKREYILFAPMTKEQTDLYKVISDENIDTREYLQSKIVERLTKDSESPASSAKTSPRDSRSSSASPKAESKKAKGNQLDLTIRSSPRKKDVESPATPPVAKDAFALMMGKKRGRGRPPKEMVAPTEPEILTPPAGSRKRKNGGGSDLESPTPKSAKSSRQSTPGSVRSLRVRKTPSKYQNHFYGPAEDDDLDDKAFEAKLAKEIAQQDEPQDIDTFMTPEELERAKTLELAKKEIANKKLGNPVLQLRLVCNSPHHFYNPWAGTGARVDETLITSSGKMLLLDHLLPALFKDDHKVLIFSQFKTQLDILEDYCRELRGWDICRIDGGVPQGARREQIERFNSDKDLRIFLLSTRAGGQGINLASADTVILFDSDWNPQQDLQAQDRAHRIGQTRPVIVYRLATKGTVEESLLTSADAKRRLEQLVIRKGSYKTLGQRLKDEVDSETLKALLLRDGERYKFSGEKEILSEEDLAVLCDRSEAAYQRAATGQGNANNFTVIETHADGITVTDAGATAANANAANSGPSIG